MKRNGEGRRRGKRRTKEVESQKGGEERAINGERGSWVGWSRVTV